MKPLAEARREVLAAMRPLPVVSVSVWNALGLALAEDVLTAEDVPPFANSAMDGYAVRAGDTTVVPVDLAVLEDVAAGHVAKEEVIAGTAIKIMTGAPMPDGADAVVMVENTTPGVGRVEVLSTVESGENVRPAGGDVGKGQIVFPAGTRLAAPHLGVLAAIGAGSVRVGRRPRVGMVSTGDEVQPPETPGLEPGQIRDANRPLLSGLLTELGAVISDYGIVADDPRRLRTTLLRAAEDCDAVITSGGVSMGEYDLVKQILDELGDIEFWRVAMKPAKPFAFGKIDDTPLFGLPGNPVSVLVAFEQFARPALLHMMGSTRLFRPRIPGIAGGRMVTDPAKTFFVRVGLGRAPDGRLVASESGSQMSNVLSAAAAADAFAVVPVGVDVVEPGEQIELELFRALETRSLEDAIDD